MSNRPSAVFLSYASQDAEAARRITETLRAAGVEVWFDQSELRGGDVWDHKIRQQIKECALFMPIISANTQARAEGYFRLEWKLAVDRSHLMADDAPFLFPVVIDETPDAIARVPEAFRARQWIRLPGGTVDSSFCSRVLELLRGGLAASAPGAAAGAAQRERVTADPKSIAVLPFANLSRDPENEYFADGLAEEMLDLLANVRDLRVAARTSAFSFKGRNVDIATIARQLNVASVLEGSVRRSGSRVRVSVQMIHAADGYRVWAETFDRELHDLFAIQDEIAAAVVTVLRSRLLGGRGPGDAAATTATVDVQRAATPYQTNDTEAYRLLIQAKALQRSNVSHASAETEKLLRRALELDANYAPAWVALGETLRRRAATDGAEITPTVTQARAMFERAQALQPDLAEVWAALGFLDIEFDWNWERADRLLRRAMELGPGKDFVVRRAAVLHRALGRFEAAVDLSRRAVDLDPLNPGTHVNLGLSLFYAGDREGARNEFLLAIELSPQGYGAWWNLASLHLLDGRVDEAQAAVEREPAEFFRRQMRGMLHHARGEIAQADAALAEFIERDAAHSAYQVAEAFSFRRNLDPAFHWLERAYAQRDAGLSDVRGCPFFYPLYDDPRWLTFLRKMGVAETAPTAPPIKASGAAERTITSGRGS